MLLKLFRRQIISKTHRFLKFNNSFCVTPKFTYATKGVKNQGVDKSASSALIERFLKIKTRDRILSNKRNDYCTKSNEEGEELCVENEARYNYHEDIEAAINKQITSEFSAAYSYLSISCQFGRTSVGLLGTQKFFESMYKEEVNHAMKLIKYQQTRGGHVQLTAVPVNECTDCSILKSLTLALTMEKAVSDILFELLNLSRQHHDIPTEDFIITEFMKEQLQCIRNLGNLIATATRMNETGVDQLLLDKEMQSAVGHTLTKI